MIALDEAQDLTASIDGGQLAWQAPAGEWFVVVMTDDLIYEGTHAAISLAYKKPCIDLLTPEPTARFLEVTHERYAEKLGQDLGRYFVSTFTDEPSLQNYWFRPMPYRVLPWSLTIEREFSQRRGRELRPLLPALVAEAGPAARGPATTSGTPWANWSRRITSARSRPGAASTTSSPAVTC